MADATHDVSGNGEEEEDVEDVDFVLQELDNSSSDSEEGSTADTDASDLEYEPESEGCRAGGERRPREPPGPIPPRRPAPARLARHNPPMQACCGT
jgi:hypothetical protein